MSGEGKVTFFKQSGWMVIATTLSGVALRLRPRTYGMMQNEQRLLQPSWIFRLGRVRSPAASFTGADRKSWRAKISPTWIWP